MISHQTVGVNPATELTFEFDEVFPVIIVVVIRNENGLAVVTTLDDVMRSMGQNYSG